MTAFTRHPAQLESTRTEQIGDSPGLFRAVLGGGKGLVRPVFDKVENAPSKWHSNVNSTFDAASTEVEVNDQRSRFKWHFMRLGHDVLVVTTRAKIVETRVEKVKGEGYVEFHFLLEGPVGLGAGATTKKGHQFKSAELICCRQPMGLEYDVRCGAGSHTMVSIYADPDYLRQHFDFPQNTDAARAIVEEAPDLFTMIEARLPPACLSTLRSVVKSKVRTQRDLMAISGLVLQLLAQSVGSVEAATQSGDPAQSLFQADVDMLEAVREQLHHNLGDKLTLADLAKEMGTNTTKLKAGFKLLNGTTIHKYRTDIRMDYALKQLRKNSNSVAVIGHAIGFDRQASFSSAFKSYFGVPPKFAAKVRTR